MSGNIYNCILNLPEGLSEELPENELERIA